MECRYELQCLNTKQCYRCYNESLLKLPTDKQRKKYQEPIYDSKKASASDSWKDLEQSVADALNKIPTMKEARRSIMSGALWFEKGDVVDQILHPECKERIGTTLKGGDKSISIKKEWLTKAASECKYKNQTMCLPFRFKQDDTIYNIMKFEDIADLVCTMKAYIQDNERLQAENDVLRQQIERSQQNGTG